MSLNTLKQRQYLYGKTFMEWTPENLLSTIQLTTMEAGVAVHKFRHGATNANFTQLAEKLSDVETMTEVAELRFPSLRSEIDRIKKEKLTVLKKQLPLKKEAAKMETKAEELNKEAAEVPEKVKNQKPTFRGRLSFLK